jgi:hypothetical protein
VAVGRGSWEGRLSSGPHRVRVTHVGFEPVSRAIHLRDGERVDLEPELSVIVPKKAGVVLEIEGGLVGTLQWGGDLEDSCVSECTATIPLTEYAQAHATYRLATGIGLGVHIGYLRSIATFSERPESLEPFGLPQYRNDGFVVDDVKMSGLMAGAEAEYVLGRDWPVTARLQMGAFLGRAVVTRSGNFVDDMSVPYQFEQSQDPAASFFYVGPQLLIARRLGDDFEVGVGAKLLVLAALARPTWDNEAYVLTPNRGAAYFASKGRVTGSVMVTLMPGLAVRYAF